MAFELDLKHKKQSYHGKQKKGQPKKREECIQMQNTFECIQIQISIGKYQEGW